ncbi:anaphase-promoting complex component apc8 [Coemansia spiralis]|uniref:Anaphase-promoting complex component apc8 n=2 Tax=Coemansia TaxID=4863 RepID=A0A9W8KZ82_9FUNG|nr:hypothetical protein BX070DRAFT_230973 [Coemansia spiralis]KAJ1993037.1 anaphase-promoting complex component apc8 [Coemansia umbellata]KAJ2622917.1 anaphase-promoting complex component apc8 [Coemansia sp. RSA 1358]KAJ2678168.1 anaphase-promoting complex component apc8 [Coemansia spiralis]
MDSVDSVCTQLRRAVDECSSRGLVFAAKWAAEQLCSLPNVPTTPLPWDPEDEQSRNQISLAKCLFDLREFDRASHCLRECHGPRATFLRLYSRYLNLERQKSPDLTGIRDELLATEDGFCLYLLSLVQHRLGQRDEARDSCVKSLHKFEYNWSAWLHLEALDAQDSMLPNGWMRHAHMAHLLLETFTSTSAEDFAVHLRILEQMFPQSHFVLGLRAVRHYNAREFEEASRLFAHLQTIDPYQLDLCDIHSNILFVMGDRGRLGELAHKCSQLDRFRPETCCVIGNYYSLRREHEKAIGYFQRAVQLDPKYLAAWTLVGHEFIELKNTAAAIDAYRHAVDIDQRDYRAWYGLGKTYELLNMPHYAVSYYTRAAVLRPYDSRMWCALANCHELSSQPEKAITCYRQALLGSAENEAQAVSRLARLHEDMGDRTRAAYYHQLVFEHYAKNTTEAGEQDDLAAACLFLAAFEHERGNTVVARKYLAQVVGAGGVSQQRVDEAKAVLRAMAR